jgi:tetratricopeptide (TPR) repeat protein
MNLAALELRQNNPSLALAALTEAQRINVLTVAPLNRAYVAETYGLLPRNTLISIYAIALTNEVAAKRLPIAPFWVATEVRRDALDQYLQIAPLEIQYRVLAVHDPIRAAELVPASPTDAQSWWILGQAQFTTGDLSSAATSFTRAIELAPTHGDYYAARARTTFDSNPMSAERDLNLAYLLGTLFEPRQQSPTNGATSTQESARIRAVPQEFGAVLYVGRLSGFNLLPELYPPNDSALITFRSGAYSV